MPDATNVARLPGSPVVTRERSEALCASLRRALEMAEAGELQSFVGAGFTVYNMRAAVWCPGEGRSVYETLGSLAWLQHEYVNRVTEDLART